MTMLRLSRADAVIAQGSGLHLGDIDVDRASVFAIGPRAAGEGL